MVKPSTCKSLLLNSRAMRMRRALRPNTKVPDTIKSEDTTMNTETVKIASKSIITHKTITNKKKNKGKTCVKPLAIITKIIFEDNKV